MRQLINGIVYDTDRATVVCTEGPHWVSPGVDGFLRIRETLYRGEHGKFFNVTEHLGEPSLLMRILTGDWPGEPYIFVPRPDDVRAMAWRCGIDLEKFGLREPEAA